ncbi:uncharacterized protein V6R79_020560, partial [Siganus canaliculatus]
LSQKENLNRIIVSLSTNPVRLGELRTDRHGMVNPHSFYYLHRVSLPHEIPA